MPMRIPGLGSGMDIEKMVNDLMKAERMPLDKFNQKKQILSWKTDQYREMNTKSASFRSFLNKMRFSGEWTQNKVNSSNPTAVSVTASATASTATHSIIVNNLAASTSTSSTASISQPSLNGTKDLTGTNTLIDNTNNKFNVTLNGTIKTITLTNNTYTETQLQAELQSQLDQAFGINQISVGLNVGKLSLTPNGTPGNLPQVIIGAVSGSDALNTLGFTDQQSFKVNYNSKLVDTASKLTNALTYGNFTINGLTITYDNTDSLSSIVAKVNTANAGVNMSYDAISDKIAFTTKGVGKTAQIQLQDGTGNFVSAMNLSTTLKQGTDADVTIDGVQSYRSSNTFTLDGVTYTLNGKTDPAVPITVSVTKDTDATVTKIKDFINTYNDLVGSINQRLNEQKFRDFSPLTDDQKKDMKDSDITLWESKARSGLLRNDNILSSVRSSLRSLVSQKVDNINTAYDTLYKIGITTMPYDRSAPNDSGKLVLDESKLRAALTDDPNGVVALFANQPADTAPATEKGIAQAMYEKADKGISNLIDAAGLVGTSSNLITNTLGHQIHDLELKITDWQAKLITKEDYYYKQFGAMDKAIQNGNAQMSWLMSQFGGG